jgi:hypothetical protein
MASNTRTVKRDPYADLPRVPDFPLRISVVADGETMPSARRLSDLRPCETPWVRDRYALSEVVERH